MVTSILRMVTFMHAEGFFQDPTYKCVPTMMYTIVEASTYLIASCMPALRPLKRHIFGEQSLIKSAGSIFAKEPSQSSRTNGNFGAKTSDRVMHLKLMHKELPQTPEDHKRLTLHVENDGFSRLHDKSGYV